MLGSAKQHELNQSINNQEKIKPKIEWKQKKSTNESKTLIKDEENSYNLTTNNTKIDKMK